MHEASCSEEPGAGKLHAGICEGGAGQPASLVRLKAQLDSRVKVPDLADTEWPITESNCAGAITSGGEQLEVNDQSVTQVNSIRSAVLTSLLGKGEVRTK